MKGFTFIELMIIIAIMGILLGIALLPNKSEINKDAYDEIKKCKAQLFPGEMCVYKFDNYNYEIYIDRAAFG